MNQRNMNLDMRSFDIGVNVGSVVTTKIFQTILNELTTTNVGTSTFGQAQVRRGPKPGYKKRHTTNVVKTGHKGPGRPRLNLAA